MLLRGALALSVIVLVILAWRLNTANTVIGEQQRQIESLKKAASDHSVEQALNSQVRCAEMANTFLSTRGIKVGEGQYKNHFNTKLRKCFVVMSTYEMNNDFVSIDLFDAAEGNHYASYNGHNICDVAITHNPRKCAVDAGDIWFNGDDSKRPDFIAGFRGLLYGGGSGDETTQETFLDHIQPFMTE
jgi:hypothetical protein